MVYILQCTRSVHNGIRATFGLPQAAEWEYRAKGLPVPAHLLPRSITVETATAFPDIYEWGGTHFIVSWKVRELLEHLIPGIIEYINIEVIGSTAAQLTPPYYYINLIERAQLVDWSRTTHQTIPWRKDKLGRLIIRAPLPTQKGFIAFRDMPSFYMWHEVDVETETTWFSFYPNLFLMSDDLWHKVDRALPNMIDPRRLNTN